MEAIGLNPIRLDAIGIDPIRLNAIRLGVPGASSGSNLPYIDPEVLASLVAICICDGKSNNDPDRAVIKNLVDPANPFVISNAAYKLNSGFGKYEEDFTNWKLASNINLSSDGTKISTISTNFSCQYNYSSIGRDVPSFKVKISNFTEGTISYYYREEDGNEKHINFGPITVANSNGIVELPKSYNTVENGIGYRGGFIGILNTNIGLTIEQIPSFQGAFYADGVNDMITSTKTMSEMLGGGNKCTVISFITHISGSGKYNFIGNSRIQVSDYAGQSFMAGCSSKSGEKIVELGDKEKIQTSQYTTFDSKLSIGSLETGLEISSYAYYGTFVFNKDSVPIDWIHQVIAYFYLDKYVTADIIYDTIRQGITNENHASFNDELVDFSGNGHNLKIYNSAWNKESGINDEGAWQTDGVSDYGQYVGDLGLKDYTIAVDRTYVEAKGSQVPIISNVVDNSVSTPFLMEHLGVEKILDPHSFGKYTTLSELNINRFISYQSTYKYNGIDITKGTSADTGSGLTIGRIGGVANQYGSICLWSFLLFPYTLSEFLLERQLKRYKLGTLYPDMIEWRPIVKSNIQYKQIDYFIRRDGIYVRLNPGDYFSSNEDIIIRFTPIRDWQLDVVSSIKINGKDEVINVSVYTQTNPIHIDKSPQKIDITIDEYIRYEDIVQPYPYIVKIRNNDGYFYTYGDKLKVGSEIIRGKVITLLPELYSVANGVFLNGQRVTNSEGTIIVSKNMVFSHGGYTYLKANEPNCIADPQRLRIPNSSYKILGYIPDISGHGNHLKINNSAYAGMSGANGYIEPFNDRKWNIGSSVNKINRTDNKITVASLKKNKSIIYVTTGTFINEIKVVATGIPVGGELIFHQDTDITIPNNVVVTVGGKTSTGSWGFIVNDLTLDWSNLVIQQIGEYEGSFCLDGVDDFITIPTLASGAKQVLMKVNWKNYEVLYDQRTTVNIDTFAIFCRNESYEPENIKGVAYNNANNGDTYIDSIRNENIITEQLEGITHNIISVNDEVNSSNSKSPVIGCIYTKNANFSKMALFAFMSFDEISSEDEIKELNDIVGIEGNTDDLFNETNI